MLYLDKDKIMKNTIKKGKIHLLIYKSGDGFVGICKEFGFVEEANNAKKVEKKLINGAVLLLETVKKNPRLEPSLNVRPPFKYLCLFYLIPIIFVFSSIFSRFKGSMQFMQLDTHNLSSFCNA